MAGTGILSTYGQFIEGWGAPTFHEGLDIIVPSSPAPSPVLAIEAGQFWAERRFFDSNDYISVQSGNEGWNFVHATPTQVYAPQAQIQVGDHIADVTDAPAGYPRHLHLDYTSGTADSTTNNQLLRPIGNPLDHLVAPDVLPPIVDPNGFHFRTGATDNDANNTHVYFSNFGVLIDDVPLLGGDIDIIANVWDPNPSVVHNGHEWRLAPYSVSFRILGTSFSTQGDNIDWVTPFAFTGEFLNYQGSSPPPAGQNYAAFRNSDLTRTVYEYDNVAHSQEGSAYYFILTNYSGDQKVDFYGANDARNDRARSWQSTVSRTSGKNWYDVLAAGERADVNAHSKFRDGFYELAVRARDADGNTSVEADKEVLLANFSRLFTGVRVNPGQYQIDARPNWLANDTINVYQLDSIPTEGKLLVNPHSTIRTDANGTTVQDVKSYTPGKVYVADYDHDGIYFSPMDAYFLPHDDQQGPSPLSAVSVGPGRTSPPLTQRELNALLAEATRRWGLTGADTSALAGIDIRVADLGGTTLGYASGKTIWVDDNAAGWGWFIDRTPRDDSEFTRRGNQAALRRMDLLSVLMHEEGHLLGLTHGAGVMSATLNAGQRFALGSGVQIAGSADLTHQKSSLFDNWLERDSDRHDGSPVQVATRRFVDRMKR